MLAPSLARALSSRLLLVGNFSVAKIKGYKQEQLKKDRVRFSLQSQRDRVHHWSEGIATVMNHMVARGLAG